MQCHTQPIHGTIHGRKNTVVDVKPSLRGFYRRRAGTYLHFVPMIRNRLDHWHRITPVNQVRRPGQPDAPGVDFRVGPIEPCVAAIEGVRKNHDIAHVCLTDQRHSLDCSKIARFCQTNAHAKPGVSAVSNIMLIGDGANSRIFDPVFLVHCEFGFAGWHHERLGICLKLVTVIAPCDTDNRSSITQVRAE